MKQVVLRKGKAQVVDVPAPAATPGFVLVANEASAISSGTERSVVNVAANLRPTRAVRSPDLVMRTLQHAREHGLRDTVDVVRGTLAKDNPIGYSSAGTVLDTGGQPDLHVGRRVACAGAGRASHAEVVSVPMNLVCPVPEGVSARDASFVAIGAIALQGVRRAQPALGERIVVAGLGLLGLIATQMLVAAGCRVLGVEPVERRRQLGEELGAELVVGPESAAEAVNAWSDGNGADAVVVAASAKGDEIVNGAMQMLRRKGRLVVLGDVGLGLEREPLYAREADVLISTSYGPGRYDATYEEQGLDYPLPYVRWTARRNMEEFLRLLASGAVELDRLVELEVPVERAEEAYAAVRGESPPLAAALTYPERHEREHVSRGAAPGTPPRDGEVVVALIGAGSFLQWVHGPNLKRSRGARVKTVISRGGLSAASLARSFDGAEAATDWRSVLGDPEVDLVVVGTRHDSHAEMAAAALRAGKAVFVEKPLGLSREEIDDVWAAGAENDRLAIGFNRPLSELAAALGDEVRGGSGPVQLVYRVNAPVPAEHWLNDPVEGGGRILGEACHMFDFANWLCGEPDRVHAVGLPSSGRSTESADVTIQYADGSVASVHYSGIGPASMPKERIEVFRGGQAWVLDDFKELVSFDGEKSRTRSASGDKGHRALLERVLAACRGEAPFEPGLGAGYLAQMVGLAALESIASGESVPVSGPPRRAA